VFDCAGDKTKECKCRIIPDTDIHSDWSKKLLYSKGQKLCGRGGGKCLHEKKHEVQAVLHLYPEVYIERKNHEN